MLHGYMPRGNVDEDLYVPKGRPIQGYAIGILMVDGLWAPYPPGTVNNASTYDFPVLYETVEETANWKVFNPEAEEGQFSSGVRNALIAAAKNLEKQGVRAITGACGFFANFQKEVAASVDVPVFLSSLCQIPVIRQGLKPGQKIGIMTAASDLLGAEAFHHLGIDDISDLAIVGAQDYGEFYKVRGTHQKGHFNPFKVEQDLATLAGQLVTDNPEVGAILLECAAMPPYAWAIQNAVNLAIFDFYTLIEWIYKSVVRRPFAGWY